MEDFGGVEVEGGLGSLGVGGTYDWAGEGLVCCGIVVGGIVGDGKYARQLLGCRLADFMAILSLVPLVSGQSLVGCAQYSP